MLPAPASDLAALLARRIAERDNPPPPPPLSQEPAAVQARLESWLRTEHGVGHCVSRRSLGLMVLALLRAPSCTTQELGRAAGLGPRMATRAAERLRTLGISTWQARSYWRDHRLTRATEDALLVVVAGPGATIPNV